MNWAELLNRMAHWQRTQFPETTVQGALAHLKKEVNKELTDIPTDPEEWADAFFLVVQGGTKAAGSLNMFRKWVEDKMDTNEAREWPAKPAADGSYEHIKG